MVIKKMHPDMSDKEVAEMVPNYCARPSTTRTPTPHLTGGAVDVALINLETGKPFDRGHRGGAVRGSAYPDFHEGYHLKPDLSDIEDSAEQTPVVHKESEIVIGRRVLYYAMTEVAGMHVNPHEIWHYGKGDPLSEFVSGSGRPYYGIAELPEWYQQQMNTVD